MADAKWYVIQTYSGYENTVKATIEKTVESRQLQEQILHNVACVEMGFDMDNKLDLKSMSKNTMALETTLSKLDAMSDQMDEVFNSLDGMMGSTDDQGLSDEESDAQAAALLDQIMDRHNIVSYPELSQPAAAQPVAAQPVAEQPAAEQPAANESDAIRERLLKMRQELQD